MTKGALYHHFDPKDALATAIIEQGTSLTHDAFRHVCESSSPALENLIHGVFVVTDLLISDKKARTAEQLTRALAEFNTAASQVWSSRLDAMATHPASQAPKATCAKASIPTWSANPSSTPCSAPNCSPKRQTATTTSSD